MASSNKPSKQVVQEALAKMFTERNSMVIDSHFYVFYKQHDGFLPTGREPVRALVQKLAAKGADFKYENARIISDGNLVVAHGRYTGWLQKPQIVFDIFRVDCNLMCEHWSGNCDENSTPSENGHSMVDGASEIKDLDKTAANKALVIDFITEVMIKHNQAKLPSFYNGDALIQHNPLVKDGLSGLIGIMKEWKAKGIVMEYKTIHRTIAEGNFVFVHSEGTLHEEPYGFFDLFRVENGFIAEHWDVMQPIPKEFKHTNGFF